MSAISSLTYAPPSMPLPPPAPTSAPPVAQTPSRDAQIADLGDTTAQVNALQSLAAAQPANLTVPQVKHTAPPQAAMTDELIAPPAGDDDTP